MSTAITFTVTGEPMSKARPRFTGYGSKARAYTPQKVKDAEMGVALAFRAAGGRFEPDKEVTFAVVATFFNGTRQRRDVDNMIKLVLDGLNGVAWVDDTQVMEVTGRKLFTTKEAARIEVEVRAIGRMDRLTAKCAGCGGEFVTYRSWGTKRYCSDDCRLAKRRAERQKVCPTCGATFTAHSAARGIYCSVQCKAQAGWTEVTCTGCGVAFKRQKCQVREANYCTAKCRDAAFHEQRKLRSKGVCVDCAGPTSDKRRKRCQPCQWAYRAATKKPAP